MLAVALVPWVVVSTTNHSQRSLRLWVVPTAVVAFAASRLPSGNVWDAVLDPWLWLALHAYVARVFWRTLRR